MAKCRGTVGLALGYGRKRAGGCGNGIGVDANPWLSLSDNSVQYYATAVNVSNKIGVDEKFACVQHHHTMGVTGIDESTNETINVDEKEVMSLGNGFQGGLVDRSVIFRTHLDKLEEFGHDLDHKRAHFQELNDASIYPDYSDIYENGHHWGLHVDLNACTGCGACTVACMAENNVPVVGKNEVSRHHEMTWLRIDRYFYGDVDNPNVVYQPMMCQHCDNAPL